MARYNSLTVQVEAVTFDQLVQFGLDNGANVQNGMPWSFIWQDHAITHENDDLYLIPRVSGTGDLKIGRGDILFDAAGIAHVLPRETFRALFLEVT